MKHVDIFGLTITPWVYAPAVYFIWISFLLIVRRIVFNRIQRLAAATTSKIDDMIIESLELPVTLLIFASGLLIVDMVTPLGREYQMSHHFHLIFQIAAITSLIIFLDRICKWTVKTYSTKVEIIQTSGNLIHTIVRIIVLSLGLLITLDSFGISITPLVASLGVGSLAVALALQPTLENFFSGLQLVMDKLIRVGDFIKLDSGEEGFVQMISWRSTWIRTPTNNMIILPNKVLVNSKVFNYHYPSREVTISIPIGVHYGSDLNHVERVAVDVAKEVLREVPGGISDSDPAVRFHTFGDFSIHFNVTFRAREFGDGAVLRHEYVKRLHKRFAKENIVIPYPVQAINTVQEK